MTETKTALITGSTVGIGFAIANALAQEGMRVAINGRAEERVTAAINKIKAQQPHAKLIPAIADLGTKEGVDNIIKKIPEVDILVNNLGIYVVKKFPEITDAEWLNIFNINVMSGVRLCRHYFPLMLKKNYGRIIFISSESAIQPPVEMIHYGMTKTAQLAIARGLAEMTSGTHVTVNSVLPGPTRSEGVENYINQNAEQRHISREQLEKEFFAEVRPNSLIKRFITSEEVAALVAYLCSPLASAINGTSLRVDGGVVRSIV
jgi:NAD(P)-dependent dehydrogenase (short-subunit alcohol dehydrogenase family)